MAKQTPSQKTEHSFVEEAFGLLLIFIMLLLFVSLFSFDPSDPSLNHAVSKKEVHNLGGLFGAYLAGFLNDFFGTASLLLPLSITGIGAVCIFHITVPWWRWLGFSSLSLCLLVLCYALDISLFGLTNGGIVGLLLGQMSSKLLSPFGSSLFWFFASAFSLQLLIGFSWTAFFHNLSEFSSSLVRDIKERKEKKEKTGEERGGKEEKAKTARLFSFIQRSKKDSDSETEEKKIPRKKKAKKRKPIAEEDMPFAGSDELGLPFDSSFAQGYPPLYTHEEQEKEETERVEQPKQKEKKKSSPQAEKGSLLPLLGNEAQQATEVERQKTVSNKREPKKGVELALPPLNLLLPQNERVQVSEEDIRNRAVALMNCLKDFGIQGELVRTTPGPVVTTYMVRPAPGVPVRLFVRHGDDIALSLKALSVFIQAPVPGTDTVGIIIPNPTREIVNFREIAEDEAFRNNADSMSLPLIIGKNTIGKPYIADLARMPHLLIAGATGQGKSVCLNAILTSLLLRKLPSELKIVLVDPKRVEMGIYEDESHLIHPVVKEISDAKNALQWAVQEMDNRYEQMARLYTKNIFGYNAKIAAFHGNPPEEFADFTPMPFIVIIIDELADLMLQARKDVEPCIIRLAQLARACGIHMILATQRPSVDVVTGLIKANFPCRLCFTVSSRQDSVTTLGTSGAEKLLGAGDMFYNPNGGQLVRLHGPYLKDEEVQAVVEFWKQQQAPKYEVDFSSWSKEANREGLSLFSQSGVDSSSDPMYQEVLKFIKDNGTVSTSLLQRRFNIGFNKAARYMDRLDKDGFVGPAPGAGKPRPVIMH